MTEEDIAKAHEYAALPAVASTPSYRGQWLETARRLLRMT